MSEFPSPSQEGPPSDEPQQDSTLISFVPRSSSAASRKRSIRPEQAGALVGKRKRPAGLKTIAAGPHGDDGAPMPTSGSGTALGSLATASTAASTGTTSCHLGRGKPQTCDPLSSSDCSDTERVLAKLLCSLFHSLKRKRNVSQGNSAAVVWGANPVTVPVISGQTVTESGRLQSMLATQGMPASPAIPANTLPAPVQPTLPPVDVNPLLHTANSAVQIPTQQLGYEVLCGVTSLAHSVPDTIKEKILKREYIDILFNAGHCTWKNCKFRHTCSTCGFGSHPAAQCRTSKDQRQFPQQQVGHSPDFASPNPGPR
ncbi:uncharacterized protein LOC115093217 [Rhinatrema bivittatum]|uniref:uncharacterized protein LOC115093217 n=1 Tax=Rhinatrema bivittatum TaxID=194408 RepID=UPI0011275DD0|nr:uncharacterized protein LOC115093217 [Rhinatrema bivittatum]